MPNDTESKFGDPDSRIAQTARWTLLLRPKQPTLGSLVLVCREPVRAFGDVSTEGYTELGALVRRVESTLREFTAFERINWLMLMMVDPDVHFHVIPRYTGTRSFAGQAFDDAGWPGPPNLDAAVSPEAAVREALLAGLRQAWQRHAGD